MKSQVNFAAYSLLRRLLPRSMQQSLGSSSLLAPVRDRVLRPDGQAAIVNGQLDWEDLSFMFGAPYQVYLRARERGVENKICRLVRYYLRPGDTAVDVGANYGFVSLVMGFSVGPKGKVLSMEIDPAIAQTLKETAAANGLAAVIQVVAMGAGARDSDGTVTVDSVVDGSGGGPIHFLKVDTDGADYSVLQGAIGVLREFRPIVVVEFYQHQEQIYELLQDCGYTYFLAIDGHELVPGEWPINLIAADSRISIPPEGIFIDNGGH